MADLFDGLPVLTHPQAIEAFSVQSLFENKTWLSSPSAFPYLPSSCATLRGSAKLAMISNVP